jgi:hypothetical protein
VKATHDVFSQGLTLLEAIDAGTYAQAVGEPYGASIGGHYRHVLDHFLCVAAGLASGVINYDERSRDHELESNKAHAGNTTMALMESLRTLPVRDLERPCEVVYTVGYSAEGPDRLPTTFARELAFCVSHAVHHFATIKLLCDHLSVPLKPEFGVAPATLRYRESQAAN